MNNTKTKTIALMTVIIGLMTLTVSVGYNVKGVSAYFGHLNPEYNYGYDYSYHYDYGYDPVGPAYFHQSPYDIGIRDANYDCYTDNNCWTYSHSAAFYQHSQSYKEGYMSVVKECFNGDDLTPIASSDDNNSPQAYSNNGNTDTTIDKSIKATDTTQKSDVTQNVVNTPTIICKGICNIPNVVKTSSDINNDNNGGGGPGGGESNYNSYDAPDEDGEYNN